MGRSKNAQIAVDLYQDLQHLNRWNPQTAWHGIAELLLTCEIWRRGCEPFHNVVVYRESNDFKLNKDGSPNAALRSAEVLSTCLASELGIERQDLCGRIGTYWRQPGIADLQYNNLVGHAFRSLTVRILEVFGSPDIQYFEEVDPLVEFSGHEFKTRSVNPKLDIVARKGTKTVALLSTRWRFRHDRVKVVDEALAYAPAAHRHNPNCVLYAITGKFSPNLAKIMMNCPPLHSHPPLDATVHFAPQLIRRMYPKSQIEQLRSLAWLI